MKSEAFVLLYGNAQQDSDIETMGALEFVSPLHEALVAAGLAPSVVDGAMASGYNLVKTGDAESLSLCLIGYIRPLVSGLGKPQAVDALDALISAFKVGSEDPAMLASLIDAACNAIVA